jgi:hypothetical protein
MGRTRHNRIHLSSSRPVHKRRSDHRTHSGVKESFTEGARLRNAHANVFHQSWRTQPFRHAPARAGKSQKAALDPHSETESEKAKINSPAPPRCFGKITLSSPSGNPVPGQSLRSPHWIVLRERPFKFHKRFAPRSSPATRACREAACQSTALRLTSAPSILVRFPRASSARIFSWRPCPSTYMVIASMHPDKFHRML